ncbi:bifunctional 4-hydroxy-2-oxoglutarate aldolase/2-dehydro-3-deoxy-phosphogluconate aldolase [Pseudonocardia sp. RS11V-5]|uniref:bifunctional 4-hydroxy-2-oxoglutarate aldolase/2-dehydro-3-deoxy-phosphogluconate aldolase n=1 Tax=Pseudonocardia terrae TaxID=2905831 RepID=UPI001E57963C|nr:bifunctional 4-hydroxy-2-oxoglutarate aldolase/2-dehydro-3-deoxy-phosphogluconate aldolase [Pseudonocardia terrae]MCE3552761.1 bifunctional 4-hydroxy-2-oxoglutarate aldolase/2-dehydro-3-deoxy-phosphogluconate aldolase [Pseudonocardia terrae]
MTLSLDRVAPSEALRRTGVVSVLRADSPEYLLPAARTLVGEGLVCLELTMTTPGALDSLRLLRAEFGDSADVGLGSVRGAEAARRALEAGAAFLVSPVLDTAMVAECVAAGVPAYPAGTTPTELITAWDTGASAVKLFPAGTVGPGHLKAVREPLPELAIMPTGGIGVDDVGTWLQAGALAVGLGGSLSGDALRGGDLGALADRAARALAAARQETRP